jgi:hypothetical protein
MAVRCKSAWACVIVCAALAGLAGALTAAGHDPADEANPYAVIWDRNIFRLNPEPPPPPPPPPKPPDLPKVMLTGFVGKGSSTKILLAILPKDTKEATYYACLVPGQMEHGVQLVNIRLDKQEVDILNSGTRETLSVESNSYAATATAPAPHTGGGAPGMTHEGAARMPPGMFHRQPRG